MPLSSVQRPDLFYIEKFQNESLRDLRLQIKQDPKLLKLILSNLSFHKSVLVQSPVSFTLKAFELIPKNKCNSKEADVFFKTIAKSGILRFRKSGELIELFNSALKLESSQIALKFIELGMNLNIRNRQGKSLLHNAAFYGKADVVQKLIEKGMNINALDDHKMTPLHLACKKGHTEIVKKLLQKRAKLNLQNKGKKTPLMIACKYGRSSAALALLERTGQRKPLIHIKSNFEKTALHYAAENNLTEVVKILLAKGANVLERSLEFGETPKTLALMTGSKECSGILPEDPYSLEFICRKLISHFNSLAGKSEIDGFSIPLEGAYPELMHEKIGEYFEDYANEVETGLTCLDEFHLFKAFEKASQPISIKETVDSIKKKKLTILSVAWEQHAFDLVFYDQTYFVICNGGEGVSQKKTIVAYKFDATKINENLISKVLSYDNTGKEVSKIFFYNLLPKQIAFSDDPEKNKDDICDLLEKSCNQPFKNGICCSANGKIALRAASILLKIAKKKREDKEQLQLEAENMKKMTQDAATYFGIKSQSDYLEHGLKTDSKFFDVHFISEPLLNSEQKVKKRASSEFIKEAFDELLEKYIDLSSTESPNKKMAINREFHA